ncbi:hypothetical protein DIPPA_26871 [Diplonema papillatum]|nr:hypothetical protein DIPPA_26871 [Diplonema papillatum]
MNVSRWSSRMAREGTGVTGKLWPEMLALAATPGVVNSGQGFPDHKGCSTALAAAHDALDEIPANQYSPIPGLSSLNAAVSKYYKARYPASHELNPPYRSLEAYRFRSSEIENRVNR